MGFGAWPTYIILFEEIDATTQIQILKEAVCISHSVNALEKGMNPTILPRAGWVVWQIGLFKLGWVTDLKEGKFWILKLHLKADLILHHACVEGVCVKKKKKSFGWIVGQTELNITMATILREVKLEILHTITNLQIGLERTFSKLEFFSSINKNFSDLPILWC